ncbi:MAG: carboxypeptidase-like regulatory domain-containing protein [Bacteroidota bacterium]
MKYLLLICCCWLPLGLWAQFTVSGTILDEKGRALFGANVQVLGKADLGSVSGLAGEFEIKGLTHRDSLRVSFLGYAVQKVSLRDYQPGQPWEISLEKEALSLQTVSITARDPITQQFSTTVMKKLDIYLNPVAQGDPLKAITALPASTTIDESANPSLRGSSADRSRVVLNGVPVYNPVRASQLNNQGFFSLFNPEVMEKQYVYASNPPLTFGNTSAGLVDIQLKREAKGQQFQASVGLSSLGLMLTQPLKGQENFVQAYSNYQFSEAFIRVNQANLPRLKDFDTQDAGLHLHLKVGEKTRFRSFNYGIKEGYAYLTHHASYEGNSEAGKRRFFSLNSLTHTHGRSILSLHQGWDVSDSEFSFGNLRSERQTQRWFASANHKWTPGEGLNFQYGFSWDRQALRGQDTFPTYYFARAPEAPASIQADERGLNNLEVYAVGKWDIRPELVAAAGVRKNVPLKDQSSYLSFQGSLAFDPAAEHHLLLSGGRYHSYATPSFFAPTFRLLSSEQIALDYQFTSEQANFSTAFFWKREKGDPAPDFFFPLDQTQSFGWEVAYQQFLGPYFQLNLSHLWLRQEVWFGEEKARGPRDFPFFPKASLSFNHPRWFSCSLVGMVRPGTAFTPITGGTWREDIGYFEPLYPTSLYGAQYTTYARLDASMSRYFRLGSNALIVFLNLGNVLNRPNQRTEIYSQDYTSFSYELYQLRTLYVGVVWQGNR